MYQDVSLYIDGGWAKASGGRTIPVVNPATGEEIGTFAHADKADLERAAPGGRQGLQGLAQGLGLRPLQDHAQGGRPAAQPGRRHRQDHDARSRASRVAEAKMEILAGADVIDWFAEEGRRAYGRVIPARAEGVYQLVVKEPVGPVAAFTPWNFPINQAVRKISAALAAGCSIVIKGAEDTPALARRAGPRLRGCRRAGRRDQPRLRRSRPRSPNI